jgi:FixJ family two-component response regulator
MSFPRYDERMTWSKQAALLDDDDLILRTWALAARQAGVSLRVFQSPTEFLAALPGLPAGTDLFIDGRLKDGIKGEDIARQAAALGFSRIFMASGLPAATFAGIAWISGVVGKDPPWMA